jgi:biotin synthase-like enzyme
MFTEGYLTTPGQGESKDLEMIRDAGFFVRPIGEETLDSEVGDSEFSV